MEKFILAIDQGTTSSRAIVFNHDGYIRSIAQKEFTQFYPQPGWVEHDAEEIWSSQASVVAEAVLKAHLKPADIAAIGITNLEEISSQWKINRTFTPDEANNTETIIKGWHRAVKACKAWADDA